jgi:hypothetical protein
LEFQELRDEVEKTLRDAESSRGTKNAKTELEIEFKRKGEATGGGRVNDSRNI